MKLNVTFKNPLSLLRQLWIADGDRYECVIEGCDAVTDGRTYLDPRKRWILNLPLKDEKGEEIKINLCPKHVKSQFDLSEHDFSELEKMEELAASVRNRN
jgi:hypothetical protein